MYGIIRLEKRHADEVGLTQCHNDRETENHSNPDIDPSRSHLNEEWIAHGEYQDEIDRRIEERYTGKRKVREDAVRLVEGLITSSPEFFDGLTQEKEKEFWTDCRAFVGREFGEENLVFFTIHRDETTPHVHFGFTPLKDGRLAWKAFFPSKTSLTRFQTRFWEEVGRKYGLERGEPRNPDEPPKRHKDVAEFKRETLHELDREIAQKEVELQSLKDLRDGMMKSAEKAGKVLSKLNQTKDDAAADAQKWAEKAQEQQTRANTLEAQNKAAERTLEGLNDEIEAAKQTFKALDNEIQGKRNELEEVKDELADLDKHAETLEKKVTRCERLLDRMAERYEIVQKVMNAFEQMPFAGSVLKHLQEATKAIGSPIIGRIVEKGQPWQTERQARRAERQANKEIRQEAKEIRSLGEEYKAAIKDAQKTAQKRPGRHQSRGDGGRGGR